MGTMNSCRGLGSKLAITTVVAAGLSAAGLVAQVTMQLSAHTKLTAGNQSVAKGTGLHLSKYLQHVSSGAPCLETAVFDVSLMANGLRMSVTSLSQCAMGPSAGGAVRLHYSSAVPVAGYLYVLGAAPGNPSRFSVDVGNDGRAELSSNGPSLAQQILEMPVIIGPSGLDVIVDAHAQQLVSPPGSAVAAVRVAFITSTTFQHLRPIGSSCGPELTARYTNTPVNLSAIQFDVDVSRANPSASSWFVFGVNETKLPIPPIGCFLYTDLLVLLPATVSSTGQANLKLPIPQGMTSGRVIVQFLSGSANSQGLWQWRSSQAMELDL